MASKQTSKQVSAFQLSRTQIARLPETACFLRRLRQADHGGEGRNELSCLLGFRHGHHRFNKLILYHVFVGLLLCDSVLFVSIFPLHVYALIYGSFPRSEGWACQLSAIGVLTYCCALFSSLAIAATAGRMLMQPQVGGRRGRCEGMSSLLTSKRGFILGTLLGWAVGLTISLVYQSLGWLGWYKGGFYCIIDTYARPTSTWPFATLFIVTAGITFYNILLMRFKLQATLQVYGTSKVEMMKARQPTEHTRKRLIQLHKVQMSYYMVTYLGCIYFVTWLPPFLCGILQVFQIEYNFVLEIIALLTVKLQTLEVVTLSRALIHQREVFDQQLNALSNRTPAPVSLSNTTQSFHTSTSKVVKPSFGRLRNLFIHRNSLSDAPTNNGLARKPERVVPVLVNGSGDAVPQPEVVGADFSSGEGNMNGVGGRHPQHSRSASLDNGIRPAAVPHMSSRSQESVLLRIEAQLMERLAQQRSQSSGPVVPMARGLVTSGSIGESRSDSPFNSGDYWDIPSEQKKPRKRSADATQATAADNSVSDPNRQYLRSNHFQPSLADVMVPPEPARSPSFVELIPIGAENETLLRNHLWLLLCSLFPRSHLLWSLSCGLTRIHTLQTLYPSRQLTRLPLDLPRGFSSLRGYQSLFTEPVLRWPADLSRGPLTQTGSLKSLDCLLFALWCAKNVLVKAKDRPREQSRCRVQAASKMYPSL
eukprot:g1430.t1